MQEVAASNHAYHNEQFTTAQSVLIIVCTNTVLPQQPSPLPRLPQRAFVARRLLAQYAKGARCSDALLQLEALHGSSPSHMTCLALSKVRVRQPGAI